MLKRIMFFWVYILPWIILGVSIRYWINAVPGPFWVLYLIILPALYGYIVPGVGVLYMKKWKFHGPFTFKGLYFHHGLKYASNINLVFLMTFADLYKDKEVTALRAISIVLSTAASYAYFLWLHDIFSMKAGKLEIRNIFARSGKSAEEKTMRYAPGTFFIIGLIYSTSALLFYKNVILKEAQSWTLFCLYLAISLLSMIISTSLYFGVQEMIWKRKLGSEA